jgi:TRAP-type C4-dicarboxylate transport system substrate-binding protein
MRKSKSVAAVVTTAGVVAGTLALSVAASVEATAKVDGPKVAWHLSTWGPPRALTAGIEAMSKLVEQETGGNFTIKIHYGGELSKPADNLDNIKLGAFDMAQICTGYHPGKNPSVMVLDLPGLPVADFKVQQMVHEALFKHPAIVAEFKKWNAALFMSALQPQSEIMGVGDPPTKMEDYKGMRLRALGGTGAAMKNLGAVPTSVPAPEVYQALERGVFRAVAFPSTYAFASYKIAEIGKWYTTNLAPGANGCPTILSLASWSKLPKQYQELMEKNKDTFYAAIIAAHGTLDKKNLAEWEKKGLKSITYSDAELAKFEAQGAKPVWTQWVKDNAAKGVPAQELLDLALAEAKKAKKALGK